MIAFIGLGNIGPAYANTKHNAGFWVLDEFAKRQNLLFQPGKGDYLFAQHTRRKMLLVKPTTGMNHSGNAIKDLIYRWDILLTDIYVVVDDVDLPLGTIRIRPKGGDGCHRGMQNIIYHLESNQFPRIRLGIATNEQIRPAEDYVLKPFRPNDIGEVIAMVKCAADALQNIMVRGLNPTMNQFNS